MSLSQAFKEYADLRRTGADLNDTTTRSVLLERCCFDVMAMGKSNDVKAIETVSLQTLGENLIRKIHSPLNSNTLLTVCGIIFSRLTKI